MQVLVVAEEQAQGVHPDRPPPGTWGTGPHRLPDTPLHATPRTGDGSPLEQSLCFTPKLPRSEVKEH